MAKNKPDKIDISEDPEFHKKEWTAERIGWVALGVILLLGLLGVFGGSGLLNSATAGTPEGGFWIEHERFIRNLAPTTLTLHVEPGQVEGETVSVRFPQGYITGFEVQSIEPEPDQVVIIGDSQEYTFTIRQPTQPVTIRFVLEANRIGALRGDVVLNASQRLSIRHFSYP